MHKCAQSYCTILLDKKQCFFIKKLLKKLVKTRFLRKKCKKTKQNFQKKVDFMKILRYIY
jgi:hypothetical protein